MIQIRSVRGDPLPGAPFGEGPASALNKALEIAKDLKFKTVNMDGYLGYAEYGSGEDYIAVLGHVDVVPECDGGKYPPFAADIHDDKIFGRGATDDKGPLMAALFALKAVRDSGLIISKKVRIIFGTDEETDNMDISYYLSKEKPPKAGFTPDAFYPLVYAEKGIIDLDLLKNLKSKSSGIEIKKISGGLAPNMVPDFAAAEIAALDINAVIQACDEFARKTGYNIKAEEINTDKSGRQVIIKSIGVAAHGSTPEEGKNAILQLLAFLETLPLGPSDIKDAISFINRSINMETDGRSLGLAMEDKPSGKLSVNLGAVKMSEEKLIFTIDLRYPVTFRLEDVLRPLEQKFAGSGFRVENIRSQKPLYFPLDSPLAKRLLNVFKELTGFESKPLATGGGTYAKEMPNILAFGPIFPGEPLVEHKPDEYIKISELILNCKIYAQAIYELAK